MRVGVFIPARLESTRLPRKLLKDSTGRPLLAHTVARVLEAKAKHPDLIRYVVCAADDERLVAVATAAGADAILTRPDHPSGSARIAEAAALSRYAAIDVVVNVQGDEPEIDPNAMIQVAELLKDAPADAPMATLASPIIEPDDHRLADPNCVKCVVSASGYALYFSRATVPFIRESAESPLKTGNSERSALAHHHIGIYAYRRDFLLGYGALPDSRLERFEKLEQLRALDAGYRIRVGVVGRAAPGIDTEADYRAFCERVTATIRKNP